MKTYSQLQSEQRAEMNAFEGIFFAFDNKQFSEGMTKVGLSADDTKKIASMGAGGYILKERINAWVDMCERHKEELKQFRKNKKELFKALVYELKNHEYCITYDINPALKALNLNQNDIPKDTLKKACKQALVGVNV